MKMACSPKFSPKFIALGGMPLYASCMAIQPSKSKRGRKAKDFVCPWNGVTINGLYNKPGTNVWRIRATGQEYTEPDERQAIARFEAITRSTKAMTQLPLPTSDVQQAIEQARAAGFSKIRLEITPGQQTTYSVAVGSGEFYAAVRRMLLETPQALAHATGVEWVAWGPELSQPQASPRLAAIGDSYFQNSGVSANEISRSRLFWKEFVAAVGVTTVREIDHAGVFKYEQKMLNRKLSPKSRLHRIRKVRGIFHFAIRRGQSPSDCRAALDVLAMLRVKNAHPLDPTPISKVDFWRIYDQAKTAGDDQFATMLLIALNAGLYPGEIAALRWNEIDLTTGGLVTRRPKTKVVRIAVLWSQTTRALKQLPHQGEAIFYTRQRSFTVQSASVLFRRYRDAAGVAKSVKFGMVRDASYSEAAAIDVDQARMLCGHKLAGQADAYLRRRPDLVAEACTAIAKAFAVDEQCAAIDKVVTNTAK